MDLSVDTPCENCKIRNTALAAGEERFLLSDKLWGSDHLPWAKAGILKTFKTIARVSPVGKRVIDEACEYYKVTAAGGAISGYAGRLNDWAHREHISEVHDHNLGGCWKCGTNCRWGFARCIDP